MEPSLLPERAFTPARAVSHPVNIQGRVTLSVPANVPPMKVPETASFTTLPGVPAEAGKLRMAVAVATAAMLPTLMGNMLLVAAAPNLAFLIVTLGAV